MPHETGATEWIAQLSVGSIVLVTFVLTLLRLALVPHKSSIARSISEMAESLIIAGVLVFLIIRPFFVQAFYIPTESMEPTLLGHDAGLSRSADYYQDTVHDHIFVNKLIYRMSQPKIGDIIVFRAEKKADLERGEAENVLIKRLVGLPGDTIEVKPDFHGIVRLFRNGKACEEPYIREEMRDIRPDPGYAVRGPLKLGPSQLFVMGDNRNNSADSRFWGTLPRRRVIGKAALVFWPLSRIRLLH